MLVAFFPETSVISELHSSTTNIELTLRETSKEQDSILNCWSTLKLPEFLESIKLRDPSGRIDSLLQCAAQTNISTMSFFISESEYLRR